MMPLDQKPGPLVDSAFLGALETMDLCIRSVMNGRFGGARRTPMCGSSAEFADYREYAPGDDLRRIDWHLAGRLDKYYVRQFVDERQMRETVYVDLSASMGMYADKARTALRLAAAVGFLAVQNMDQAVYRLLVGSRCEDLCGAVTGREAFYAAAEKLSRLSFSGAGDLGAALRADPDPGRGNGLSVVISDFLTDGGWKRAVDELLLRRREVALIQVLAPEELSPVMSGRVLLRDAEAADAGDPRNLRLEAGRSAARAYREALSYFQADIAAFCASRGVAFVSARSDEPIERIILEKGYTAGLIQ